MSLLTIYRPNFCSQCGAKIVRLRWFPWTSRKFCNECTPGLLKEFWMQPVIAALTLLLIGLMIGRSTRRQSPPLVIQRVVNETSEGTPTVATPVQDENIYTCGARTKKGTPCSRRVHGPVRCWQHKGMPAMVAQEKLLIQD